MKKAPFSILRARGGYNLIEAAIVLGIAGLVIGAIFAAWGGVTSANKLRQSEEMMTVIVGQIRTTYGNRNTLDNVSGGVFTNALLDAALLPDSWVVNNQILNPYGGNVIITPDTSGVSANKDAMNITFNKLNKADCLKLASNVLGLARTQGLFKINSTTVNETSNFSNISSAVCTSGINNISFYFKLKQN